MACCHCQGKALLAGHTPRFTDIAAGFEGMLQHCATLEHKPELENKPEHIAVVLISNGADSFPREGLQHLGRLPPCPASPRS